MHDEALPVTQPLYLVKVLAGVLVAVGVVTLAVTLPGLPLSAAQNRALLGVLVLLALMLAPLMQYLYRNRDEMGRQLHQTACVASLALTASVSAVTGILQANHVVPLLNQFWLLGVLALIWGVQLMLADRQVR